MFFYLILTMLPVKIVKVPDFVCRVQRSAFVITFLAPISYIFFKGASCKAIPMPFPFTFGSTPGSVVLRIVAEIMLYPEAPITFPSPSAIKAGNIRFRHFL